MPSDGYDHRAVEKKWQAYWLANKTFKAEIDRAKPKYYVLDMFPYPSGDGLHVGHPEGYTATDIVARFKRMRGFNVLHPMGWDAFGLPAERHAIRTGEHPAIITNKNCDTFRRQIRELGFSYDWDREINTTDPKYVKWTQWIFQILFERGLAYQMEAPVNWCPAQGTVLANEEVKDGKYVDTGDPVEKRLMRQWMLKITAYADRLLEDLDGLDWPEGIKAMQRDWIGKSTGADIVFNVAGAGAQFTVYTTRPDTVFGATFCVLAPEHPLVERITTPESKTAVTAYVTQAKARSAQDRMKEDREKTGVFTGAYAMNPATGKQIPIWIADYVLGDYGYGAIMAVPGQDERDWEFAEKFGLPIVRTVQPSEGFDGKAFLGDGPAINSGFLDGLGVADAKKKMIAWLEEKGFGKGAVNYRLRDWLFSRQRYWGEPIPLIELEDGTVKAVPMKDLPVTLPDLDEYKPAPDGSPPLSRAQDWVRTTDPATGKPAKRETNTMPQWAGSCWYFLRFVDARNDTAAWSEEAEKYWMPVDLYIGGAEHAVLHLLYSRFWHKVLYDAGQVSTKEPFTKLFNQGMILSYSYREPSGEYVHTRDQEWTPVLRLDPSSDDFAAAISDSECHVSQKPYRLIRTEEGAEFWLDEQKGISKGYEIEDFLFMDPGGAGGFKSSDVDITFVAADVQEDVKMGYASIARFTIRGQETYPRLILLTQVEKMSKSRYNVINPDEVVQNYGADAMRMYEMFMGPLDRDKPWTDEGIQGVYRFLRRVWNAFIDGDVLSKRIVASGGDAGAEKVLHYTIKCVGNDIENLMFNTAIARMMEFLNTASKMTTIDRSVVERFVLVLSPFAPHLCEELWQRLGHANTLAYESWPAFDESLLAEDTVEVPVQINGKLRARVTVPAAAGKDALLAAAKADESVRRYIDGAQIIKEIVVPGKMVNFVVK